MFYGFNSGAVDFNPTITGGAGTNIVVNTTLSFLITSTTSSTVSSAYMQVTYYGLFSAISVVFGSGVMIVFNGVTNPNPSTKGLLSYPSFNTYP